MTTKGLVVTLALDCCFSGSVLGENEEDCASVRNVVHEAPIEGATDIDDRIEVLAAGLMCEGLVLMDRNMRTLAPSQCFRSALEDDSMTIYLIPAVDMGQIPDMERQIAGLKRPASDDLLDGSQPRKRQAIGSRPMRYLVAIHGA